MGKHGGSFVRRAIHAATRAALAWIGAVEQGLGDWRPEPRRTACRRCGQSATPTGCPGCAGGLPALGDAIVRLGPYDEPLRSWLLELKRRPTAAPRGLRLGRLLGRRVRAEIVSLGVEPVAGAVVVVPVPMPLWRRIRAGVDHARVLSEGVAELLRAPVVPALRRRGRRRQAGLGRRGRLLGAGRGLERVERHAAVVRGRTVVVVDDVVTTGATIRAVVRRLRPLRPARIVIAVAAVRPWHPRGFKKLSTFPPRALTGATVCLQSRVSAENTSPSEATTAPNLLEK